MKGKTFSKFGQGHFKSNSALMVGKKKKEIILRQLSELQRD